MDIFKTFHNKQTVVAETVGFRFEVDLCKSVPIIIGFFVVMDNTGTFHTNKRINTENVGFRFEAGLFKSASMILGSGCYGQP